MKKIKRHRKKNMVKMNCERVRYLNIITHHLTLDALTNK